MDTADYVVLPFNKKYFPTDSKPFNLTPNDIKLLENMLIESVIEHNSTLLNKNNLINLNNYKIQFRAFISKSNKNLIHIHCFHKTHFARSQHSQNIWKKQVISVSDGGHWFFQVWINWDEKKVDDFTLNFY